MRSPSTCLHLILFTKYLNIIFAPIILVCPETSDMASAASALVLTPNVTPNPTTRITALCFSHISRNTTDHSRRLVVRAAEEGTPPVTTAAKPEVKAAPKPPPIGPKRGTKVIVPLHQTLASEGMVNVQVSIIQTIDT